MPIESTWRFYRGEDVERVCTQVATEDDAGTIAGREYTAAIEYSNGEILLELTIGAGIEITDAVGREYTISLTAEQTVAIPKGSYRWNTWRTDDGENAVLGTGPCIVREA